MQILMIGSQKKQRFSNMRKMFNTKKAQIVISGMLKPQIQLKLTPPPPLPAPFINPDNVVPCMAFINPLGTTKLQFGFTPCRNVAEVGSGNGIGGGVRGPEACHGA